jgi:hypothetical protein
MLLHSMSNEDYNSFTLTLTPTNGSRLCRNEMINYRARLKQTFRAKALRGSWLKNQADMQYLYTLLKCDDR